MNTSDSLPGSLSFRARLFGATTSAIMLPLLRKGMAGASTRKRIALICKLIARVPRGTRIETSVMGGVPVETISNENGSHENGRVDATFLYLHGGAYVAGSPASHRGLLAQLARVSGCRIVAADYRLAPEHPYPAALDDALAVYRALLADGIAPEKIVIAGDSAGGGLTLATALALRDAGGPMPAALICLSPWTDLTLSGDSHRSRAGRERMLNPAAAGVDAKHYAGGRDLKDPLLSPLFGRLDGLPPLLIQVGDDEVLLDDSLRFADAARRAGVPVTLQVWPGLWHVWQLYAGWMPEADAALARMTEFVANMETSRSARETRTTIR